MPTATTSKRLQIAEAQLQETSYATDKDCEVISGGGAYTCAFKVTIISPFLY